MVFHDTPYVIYLFTMDNTQSTYCLTINEDLIDFLRESNNIEDVWDDDSLAQALFAWNFLMMENKISSSTILKAHKILMLHKNLRPDQKGYFRKEPVYIGGHETKPWFAVPELVNQWCAQLNTFIDTWRPSKDQKEIAEEIKKYHVKFETIHPFTDGNGRTGRLLLNWTRAKCELPILVIKELEKSEYYKWFI